MMYYIDELYEKSLAENEVNLKYWENTLDKLKSLNLNAYSDKFKVPVLVPVGTKIFFRGELIHTNEVTVSLGDDYYAKCSTAQAEILRQHRIKRAQTQLDQYKKEREYLERQILFTKENVFDTEGQELLEVYSEEEEKAWRERHKENIKKYKQQTAKERNKAENALSDKELWQRLEELEFQEELENEILDNFKEIVHKEKENNVTPYLDSIKEEIKKTESMMENEDYEEENMEDTATEKAPNETSKHHLLQQVLVKQSELENKLHELKYKDREQSKTEQDLIERLDEMEQLDEIEDEMERLDNILQTEDVESDDSNQSEDDDSSNAGSIKLKKCIYFADDDNSKTLQITFTHSKTVDINNAYDPKMGILKPSDLYEAYSNLFDNKTTSILKKSKYEADDLEPSTSKAKPIRQFKNKDNSVKSPQRPESQDIDRAIVIRDVVEKVAVNQDNVEDDTRPTSLFKKRRMEKKS